MAKNIIIILLYIISFYSPTPVVHAMDPMSQKSHRGKENRKNFAKIISSPNWVHPNLRQNHQGYKSIKIQKQFSTMWQYSTNRQSGNIKGGGTTKYKDYEPFYIPSKVYKKKNGNKKF